MSKYKNPMDEKNNKVLKETEQQADKPMNKADSFNQANGLEVHESGKGGGERLKVIGVEEIIKARETLQKYKQQKQSLESRVVNNEEWWKIHNWEQIKKKDAVKADRENPNGIETPSSSAWLFNSITNKIADFSDNYPEANIRARTGGDVPEAERLKNVIPMILKRNKFYKTYIEDISEKSKSGTGITYVGWNPKKDGVGDVEIQNINILSIFWQGGITNIQKSRNVFTVELVDTDLLKKQYPSEAENITSDGEVDLKQYLYEDYIDTTDKSLVIDWWYKKDGKLHYCKFVNNVVLFATDEIADAIVCANNNMGVVVDSKQQYVWMRARKSAQTAFSSLKVNDADKSSSSVVQAVSAMLNYRGNGLSVKELIDNGGTPKSAIENTLKDSVVLDISGCTVEEILFYVSKGSPVFAMTGTDSAVLVTGYTSGSIYYYDPQTHSTRSKSYKDADDWFRKAGYIFFTYLDR